MNLLAREKGRWGKVSKITVTSTASQELPTLEDVNAAAGLEEPQPATWVIWVEKLKG